MRNQKSEIRNQKSEYEPNEVEIIALILTVGVWMYIILGSMGAF